MKILFTGLLISASTCDILGNQSKKGTGNLSRTPHLIKINASKTFICIYNIKFFI